MALDLGYRFIMALGLARDKVRITKVASHHSAPIIRLLKNSKYRKKFTADEIANIINSYFNELRDKETEPKREKRHKQLKTNIIQTLSKPAYLKKNAFFVTQLMNALENKKQFELVENFFSIETNSKSLFNISCQEERFSIAKCLIGTPTYKNKSKVNYGILLGKLIRAEHDEFIIKDKIFELKNEFPSEYQKTLNRSLRPNRLGLFEKLYKIFIASSRFTPDRAILLKAKIKQDPTPLPELFNRLDIPADPKIIEILKGQNSDEELSLILEKLKLIDLNLETLCLRAKVETLIDIYSSENLIQRIDATQVLIQYCKNNSLETLNQVYEFDNFTKHLNPRELLELSLLFEQNARFQAHIDKLKRVLHKKQSSFDKLALFMKAVTKETDAFYKNPNLWKQLTPYTRLQLLWHWEVSSNDAAFEDKDIFFELLTNRDLNDKDRLSHEQIILLFNHHYQKISEQEWASLKENWVTNLTSELKTQIFRLVLERFLKKSISTEVSKKLANLLDGKLTSIRNDVSTAVLVAQNQDEIVTVFGETEFQAFAQTQDPSFIKRQSVAVSEPSVLKRVANYTTQFFTATSKEPDEISVIPTNKIVNIDLFEQMTIEETINQLLAFQKEADYREFLVDNLLRIRKALFEKLRDSASQTRLIKRFFTSCSLLKEWTVNNNGKHALLLPEQKFQIAHLAGSALFTPKEDIPDLFESIFYPVDPGNAVVVDTFEKEMQALIKSAFSSQQEFDSFLLEMSRRFKLLPNILKRFYQFVKGIDKCYGWYNFINSDTRALDVYLSNNKDLSLQFFSEPDNEDMLGLFGEDLIKIYKKQAKHLENYVDRIFVAAEKHSSVFSGIIREAPKIVEQNIDFFIHAAHQKITPAMTLFKHKDLWVILKVNENDEMDAFTKKVDILYSICDLLCASRNTEENHTKKIKTLREKIFDYLIIKPEEGYSTFETKVGIFQRFIDKLKSDEFKPQVELLNRSIKSYLQNMSLGNKRKLLANEENIIALKDTPILNDLITTDEDILNDNNVAYNLACYADHALVKYILRQCQFSDLQKAKIVFEHRNDHLFKENLKGDAIPEISLIKLAENAECLAIFEQANQINSILKMLREKVQLESERVACESRVPTLAKPVILPKVQTIPPNEEAIVASQPTALNISPAPPVLAGGPPPPPPPPPTFKPLASSKLKIPAKGTEKVSQVPEGKKEISMSDIQNRQAQMAQAREARMAAGEGELSTRVLTEPPKVVQNSTQNIRANLMAEIMAPKTLRKVGQGTGNAAQRADAQRAKSAEQAKKTSANPSIQILAEALKNKFKNARPADDDEETADNDAFSDQPSLR